MRLYKFSLRVSRQMAHNPSQRQLLMLTSMNRSQDARGSLDRINGGLLKRFRAHYDQGRRNRISALRRGCGSCFTVLLSALEGSTL